MPGPALHHLLAGRVFDQWRAAPHRAPVVPDDVALNALLHGALGPDMGYFPGADPLLSELAHHARTGAFCRALVDEAETDAERAFAWGWVTHVLADVAIHPLINEACGELLLGRRTPLWGARVAVEHLRVETGLDAACHARHPELARLRPLQALEPAVFAGARRAYLRTFGAAPALESLVQAHRCVGRLLGPSAQLRGVAARAVDGRGVGSWLARGGLRTAARLSARGSHAEGLFSPVAPSGWLMDEVRGIAEGFADWFDAHCASDLRFLRDLCLDTGEPRDADGDCARGAIATLHARSSTASVGYLAAA
jgi:Zinc dependent phospholipase C